MSRENCRCRGGCRCTQSLASIAWGTSPVWIPALFAVIVLVWPWYIVALVVEDMYGVHHLLGGGLTILWWIYLLTLGTRGLGLGRPKHRWVKRGRHRAS